MIITALSFYIALTLVGRGEDRVPWLQAFLRAPAKPIPLFQTDKALRKLVENDGVLEGPPDEVRETSHSRRLMQDHSGEEKEGRRMAALE